ncbi:MAG: hypothetical protein OEW99_06285 [Gammaproteobacteria bacterium]|nr:hypothetical protein [Gammaproteobacteria bacterium]
MSHKLTWGKTGVHLNHYGVLNVEDLIYALSELIGHKNIDNIEYLIWDALDVEVANIDNITIEISTTFAANINNLNSTMKVAYIAIDEHLRNMINRYMELNIVQRPHAKQQLFNNIDDAREWASS